MNDANPNNRLCFCISSTPSPFHFHCHWCQWDGYVLIFFFFYCSVTMWWLTNWWALEVRVGGGQRGELISISLFLACSPRPQQIHIAVIYSRLQSSTVVYSRPQSSTVVYSRLQSSVICWWKCNKRWKETFLSSSDNRGESQERFTAGRKPLNDWFTWIKMLLYFTIKWNDCIVLTVTIWHCGEMIKNIQNNYFGFGWRLNHMNPNN